MDNLKVSGGRPYFTLPAHLVPGQVFTVKDGDSEHSYVARNVTYSSGSPEIRRRVRWYERFIPARWRKPVVIRAAEPATVWVNSDEPPTGRTLAQLREMKRGLDGLLGL